MPARVYSQAEGKSAGELRTLSRQAFDSADYRLAAVYYTRLLDLFPKDPVYHYYLGISMIKGNMEMDKAADLLHFPGINERFPDAGYILAQGYYLHYRWDDARKEYRRWMSQKGITRKQKKQATVELTGINAAEALANAPLEIIVYQTTDFQKGSPVPLTSVTGKTYTLSGIPREWAAKSNLTIDPSALVLLPDSPESGEQAFFSARPGKKSHANIYRIKYNENSGWGIPVPLGFSVNSPANKTFAWPDKCDSVLYFISDGLGTMGGTDVFTSQYDPATGTWGKVKNLGFPINTPANETAFFLSDSGKTAFLISDRFREGKYLTAYEIAWPPSYMNTGNHTADELTLLSSLSEKQSYTLQNLKQKPYPLGQENNHSGIKTYAPPVEMNQEDHSDYMNLLNQALQLQLQADSLFRLSESLKTKVSTIRDPQEKKKLYAQINQVSANADDLQNQANIRYSKAREMEMKYLQNTYPPYNRATGLKQKNTTGNTIIHNGNKKNKTGGNVIVSSGKPTDKTENRPPDEFGILAESPYSVQNPIPIDQTMPDGIVYRIQLGAFSKPVDPVMFHGLKPIVGEQVPASGLIRYYAGTFYSIVSAEKALQKVKETGINEAFIVSFFNGKRISLIRARELEQMIANGKK